MHGSARRPKIVISGGGSGVVSHAGSRLLAELADRAGVTGLFGDVLAGLRERRSGHDPGRVLVDLAVMLADGGTTISDLAVLRNQPDLFGPVASTATAWRVLDRVDDRLLAGLRSARATARERVWLQAADTSPLRPGNAGANTAADHITVTDRALAQIPDVHRYGTPILVCADGAARPRPGSPICGAFATPRAWTCGSRSGSP